MVTANQYIYSASFFYVHCKKHFCPKCGNKIGLGYDKKIVNSKSAEAKNYDFYDGVDFLRGNVRFITRCFYCSNCQINISFDDMKRYERELKRRNKRNKKK